MSQAALNTIGIALAKLDRLSLKYEGDGHDSETSERFKVDESTAQKLPGVFPEEMRGE